VSVRTGLAVLLDERQDLVRGHKVGIISNPNGVTADLESIVDALPRTGAKLVTLFGPEHGIHGDAQAGEHVHTTTDAATGLPIHSLFGATQKPTPEMLQGIDVLVYDMQDAGARFYTYLFTMAHCMEAAAAAHIPMIVLDRPNPLGGLDIEGPVVEPDVSSFVGAFGIPIRYGLTIGELARYFNRAGQIGCDLTVVGLQGWQRGWYYDQTGVPWVYPSPNLPTLDSCLAFAATCPIEGINVSEGRGTTRPFELFGAPYIDARALAAELNRLQLPGVRFRACHFRPSFSKWQGETCHGVQLHLLDRTTYRPVRTGLHILTTLRAMYPHDLTWIRDGVPADRLLGNRSIRRDIDAGLSADTIAAAWQPGLAAYAQVRTEVLAARP
jgi:uncharacterized protein YbbC (DUF1343 family)